MTCIIWYIYNEYLKKERELLEKARKKKQEMQDRFKNHDTPETSNILKK